MIPFNKPFFTGKETTYIEEAVNSGKISGNGKYTKLCQFFFENKYGFKKCLLTTSCTDALEMAAILLNIKEGDEVIIPSYTFVSTANAFVLRGATVVFCDSDKNHPGIDADKIEELITNKTKAIVPVHYAGMACDMYKIMELSAKYNIAVVEDAAQAIDNYYTFPNGEVKALGSIGHLSTFSFHETKNIIAGEGGMLVVNDDIFVERAEIIWEKGTNRSAFFRGEIDKYGWVDIGSSFLPSEIVSAFLYAQLMALDDIQNKRKQIWNRYNEELKVWAKDNNINLPYQPKATTNNAHMFYMICETLEQRNTIIKKLKDNEILSVFHYLSLHKSPFFTDKYKGEELTESDKYTDRLIRLPLFYELSNENLKTIIKSITQIKLS